METKLELSVAGRYIKKNGIDDKLRISFKEFHNEFERLENSLLDFIINKFYIDKIKPAQKRNVKKLANNFGEHLTIERVERMLEWAETHPKDSSSFEHFNIFYTNPEEEYSKKCKLSNNSSFDFLVGLYGEEEGNKKYEEFKSKKLISLDNFVKKYGDYEGSLRWNNFCKRNRGNHTLERKIELYGEEEGNKKYEESKVNLSRKHSLERFVELYGEEEGLRKRKELCKKHSDYAKTMENAVWKKGTPQYYRWLDIMHNLPRPKKDVEKSELFENYEYEVNKFTGRIPVKYLKNSDKRARADSSVDAYHLDHKISIKFGFEHGIPPHIIGSPENIQFLPASENCKKHDKCYSSIDAKNEFIDLNSDYFKFLEEFKYD